MRRRVAKEMTAPQDTDTDVSSSNLTRTVSNTSISNEEPEENGTNGAPSSGTEKKHSKKHRRRRRHRHKHSRKSRSSTRGFGLDEQALNQAFPFHFVFDDKKTLRQLGPVTYLTPFTSYRQLTIVVYFLPFFLSHALLLHPVYFVGCSLSGLVFVASRTGYGR